MLVVTWLCDTPEIHHRGELQLGSQGFERSNLFTK